MSRMRAATQAQHAACKGYCGSDAPQAVPPKGERERERAQDRRDMEQRNRLARVWPNSGAHGGASAAWGPFAGEEGGSITGYLRRREVEKIEDKGSKLGRGGMATTTVQLRIERGEWLNMAMGKSPTDIGT